MLIVKAKSLIRIKCRLESDFATCQLLFDRSV